MKTTEEMIEVMNAYVSGKEIEFFDGYGWYPSNTPTWDWGSRDYRIKTKPTRLEVVNKFWKDTFGIPDNFRETSCPAIICQNCPLNKQDSCGEKDRKNWWDTPMELKDGDKNA